MVLSIINFSDFVRPPVSNILILIFCWVIVAFCNNRMWTSSPCHHQPDCENPHQFRQSVRESIALKHLSAAQMHSNPYQSRTSWFLKTKASTFVPWARLRLVVFVLVLLSDVMGVEVFLLAPTVSDGDGTGPHFCVPLPPSSPRFRGIALKTPDEFPSTTSFFTLFFCWNTNRH